VKNAPRTLDLDLLLYGDEVSDDPELTLPHPRLHERAFVLAPLAEIAPQLLIPGRGYVADLLVQCADQQIEKMLPQAA
jgi:2-amino-4-hydroxy-6-hydroxymethyldihydropteridine diphosphokinase